MSTVMLHEMVGTKYMTYHINKLFSDALEECVRRGDTVDLAYCRLSPTCAMILESFYDKLDIINTEIADWDTILKHNIDAVRNKPEPYPLLDIKSDMSIQDLLAWIRTIPVGEYTPNCSITNIRQRAVLVLIIMARPDITFDLRNCLSDVYDFVHDAWANNAKPHDEYWIIQPPDVERVVKVGDVYVDSIGKTYDYGTLFRTQSILPTDFGNSQIINFTTPVDSEWQDVVQKCLKLLSSTSVKAKAKRGKTVRNFVTLRKEITQ